MHHIYHTEGIILGSKNYSEAGKYYAIFTRELGMLYASAQGVRKMSSKLRFILQDFSHLKIDLVRGKDFWRITSASKMNELREIKKEKRKLSILVNISNLLKRLLAGEEPNHPLFANLLAGFLFLEKSRLESEWRNIEIIIVLRTLHHLGYLRGSEWLNRLLQLPWGEDLIQEANRERNKILSEINRALEGSQL